MIKLKPCSISISNVIFLPDLTEAAVLQMIVKAQGGFSCSECGAFFNKKQNLRTHIESKHIESVGVSCNLCGSVYKTRDSLRKHVRRIHGMGITSNGVLLNDQ